MKSLDWVPQNRWLWRTATVKYQKGINFRSLSNTPNELKDNSGHGTHVAGIIAGYTDNITDHQRKADFPHDKINLQLMNLKVGDTDFHICHLIAAITYAIENKADVINLSLGYYAEHIDFDEKSDALFQVIKRAISEGILVVSSAGNNGENLDGKVNHYPSGFCDAFNHNLLSVASSVGGKNPNKLAKHSNKGKYSTNIAAPGNCVLGLDLNNNRKVRNGTSMAAAQISRIAAIIIGESSIEDGYLLGLSELITAIRRKCKALDCSDEEYVFYESYLAGDEKCAV